MLCIREVKIEGSSELQNFLNKQSPTIQDNRSQDKVSNEEKLEVRYLNSIRYVYLID